MNQQLFLPGILESPTPGSDHLFLAILPDPDTASGIAQLIESLCIEHELRGTPLANDRLHVTVGSLGVYSGLPPCLVRWARRISSNVAGLVPAFEIAFDRVGSFNSKSGKYPFVLRDCDGNEALHGFRSQLVKALDLPARARSSFTPHLTLLYDRHHVAEERIKPIRWHATELTLVHSLQGQSRYIRLGSWKIGG